MIRPARPRRPAARGVVPPAEPRPPARVTRALAARPPNARGAAVLYIGIDDTDVADSPGTNQLARRIAGRLPPGFTARLVVRHQLLLDPRIPYTSRNGSASLRIEAEAGADARELLPMLRAEITAFAPRGSDPGLCLADRVPAEVAAFGARCKRERLRIAEARSLAVMNGIVLEGLGGSNDGVIGALAAVGLLSGGDDGRVVHMPGWAWPDDAVRGRQPVETIHALGVDEIRDIRSGRPVRPAAVDIGKRLRPALRDGRVVLFVETNGRGGCAAVKTM